MYIIVICNNKLTDYIIISVYVLTYRDVFTHLLCSMYETESIIKSFSYNIKYMRTYVGKCMPVFLLFRVPLLLI